MKSVTVITVSTHEAKRRTAEEWDITPFTDEAMATIHSVQEQDLEEGEYDFTIVRKVDDSAVGDLYRFAAERAESEWLVFVEEGQVWPPDMLSRLLASAGMHPHFVMITLEDPHVSMVKKSYYLEGE